MGCQMYNGIRTRTHAREEKERIKTEHNRLTAVKHKSRTEYSWSRNFDFVVGYYILDLELPIELNINL